MDLKNRIDSAIKSLAGTFTSHYYTYIEHHLLCSSIPTHYAFTVLIPALHTPTLIPYRWRYKGLFLRHIHYNPPY